MAQVFFKKYWNVVHYNFYECIKDFFPQGKMIRQINHTFISLIPKTDNPTQTQHLDQ